VIAFELKDQSNLPRLYLIQQNVTAPRLKKPAAATLEEKLKACKQMDKIKPGDRVAITGSSRGIRDLTEVLRVLVAKISQKGAVPFIAPSMGAQGGGTAEGQAQMLESNGISEDTVGAPIISSTEVEEIGKTDDGFPVYIGTDFIEADHIIVVNRIKPHTDFKGKIESGLLKIMLIGMGKTIGAMSAHKAVINCGFQNLVVNAGMLLLNKLPFLLAIGIIENQFHETAYLEVVDPDQLIKLEPKLLTKAKRLIGKIPFQCADFLIVDQIGKNIAGPGMDPNVIGRIYNLVAREPSRPKFNRIFVRDLTAETHGNACGIGLADFTTKRAVSKTNIEMTSINAALGGSPEKARIPIAFNTDREGIIGGMHSAGVFDFSDARVVWIKNTLALKHLVVSEAMLDEVTANPRLEVVKGPFQFEFDDNGNLPFGLF
jgi:Lactate racemase N-terminal domain